MEKFLLKPQKGIALKPLRLLMYSDRGDVFHQHYIYSFAYFFKQHEKVLSQRYPQGITLASRDHFDAADPSQDFVICFEPRRENREELVSFLAPFQGNRTYSVHYENPIGYFFRNWLFSEDILAHFEKTFSSAAIFCDDRRHFWAPLWNFVNDFETGNLRYTLNNSIPETRLFLAVNPINTGFNVSKERVGIINFFLLNAQGTDLFGLPDLFETSDFAPWKPYWRGPIPFENPVYRFERKVETFARYRFTLVVENVFQSGYLTEKLAEPLAALSLPIYFGDPQVDFFLPRLFEGGVINGHNFSTLGDLLDFMNGMSDEEYRSRIEVIRQHRHEYYQLTSRCEIWSYVLGKIFLSNIPAPEDLLSLYNRKLPSYNQNALRAQTAIKIRSLLNQYQDDWRYDEELRRTLRVLIDSA